MSCVRPPLARGDKHPPTSADCHVLTGAFSGGNSQVSRNKEKFEPSRITPDTVLASFTPQEFLGEPYPAATATLEVWWSPRSVGKDHFTIQWYEERDTEGETDDEGMTDPTLPADYTLSCGWHQDDHHNALGEAHFQEEYPDKTTERYGVTFDDATPRWVLSECLRELTDRLVTFRERLDAVSEPR